MNTEWIASHQAIYYNEQYRFGLSGRMQGIRFDDCRRLLTVSVDFVCITLYFGFALT